MGGEKMKRNFYYLLTVVAFLVVTTLFSSCSKDETEGYYIRFRANGELVEYTNQLILTAGFGTNADIYTGTIGGANDVASNVGLQIYHNAPILEGTYSGYGGVSGVIIHYMEKSSGALFSSGGGPNADATVVITEITATTVKGTFHGKIMSTGQPDIVVTNGSYFVRRAN
jgi:hypothetical protein